MFRLSRHPRTGILSQADSYPKPRGLLAGMSALNDACHLSINVTS